MADERGKKAFFDEEEYNPKAEGVTAEQDKKKEMFKQDSGIRTPERRTEQFIMRVEPSLKERTIALADELGVAYADVIRSALLDFLEKRGV